MGPTLLTFFVYLSAVEGARSSFQSQFFRCCQCMVAARRLFATSWLQGCHDLEMIGEASIFNGSDVEFIVSAIQKKIPNKRRPFKNRVD